MNDKESHSENKIIDQKSMTISILGILISIVIVTVICLKLIIAICKDQ